jgi:polyisoprenoid-binding protein YceI
VTGEILGRAPLTELCGWVEAPVATLRTGKARRDADLNRSMESEQFPTIRYGLHGVTVERWLVDTADVVLHGSFLIHGVTRRADLPARIVLAGERAAVVATVPLNLKDYGIGGLSKMLGMLKMHEEIVVHVDLVFGMEPDAAGLVSEGERREVYGAC